MYLWKVIKYLLVGMGIGIISHFLVRRQKKFSFFSRDMVVITFGAYILALLSQTIFPKIDFGILSDGGKPYINVYYIESNIAQVNLIPFNTIVKFITGKGIDVATSDILKVSMLNILGNVVLFMPLGFLMPVLWGKCRTLKIVLAIGIIISVFIEIVQFFIGRSLDIDDVILNSIGCVSGYIVYKCIVRFHVLDMLGDHKNE